MCKECTNMALEHSPRLCPVRHPLEASRGLEDGEETKIGHEGLTWTAAIGESRYLAPAVAPLIGHLLPACYDTKLSRAKMSAGSTSGA